MNVKLVIFDMDGVLVDACDWHKGALNKALLESCNYQISEKDHYSTFNGLPTKTKLKKLSDLGIIDIIKEQAQYDLSKVELISWLKNNNIKVACFTNSIRKTAELMLDKSGILPELDMLVTNQDVEKPKPDPEGYNKIVNHFKFRPQDVIIVEDSPKGIEAANATGCKVMKVDNATQVHTENMRRFIDESFDSNGG
jgi:beta-phosphoglucomutase